MKVCVLRKGSKVKAVCSRMHRMVLRRKHLKRGKKRGMHVSGEHSSKRIRANADTIYYMWSRVTLAAASASCLNFVLSEQRAWTRSCVSLVL